MKKQVIAEKAFQRAGIDSKRESAGRRQIRVIDAESMFTGQAEEYLRANYASEFDAFLAKGLDPMWLTASLCRFVLLERLARELPKTRGQALTRGLAMTEEQLEYLPGRIRAMADDIQKVNDATLPMNGPVSATCPEFLLLPETLKAYASFLKEQGAADLADYKAASSTARGNQELLSLVKTVQAKAQRPMLREIASLIQGTEEALTRPYDMSSRERQEPSLDVGALKNRLRRINSKVTRPEK